MNTVPDTDNNIKVVDRQADKRTEKLTDTD